RLAAVMHRHVGPQRAEEARARLADPAAAPRHEDAPPLEGEHALPRRLRAQRRERCAAGARLGYVGLVVDALAARAGARIRLVRDHRAALGAVLPDDLDGIERQDLAGVAPRLGEIGDALLVDVDHAGDARARLLEDPRRRLRLAAERRPRDELAPGVVLPLRHNRAATGPLEGDALDLVPRHPPERPLVDADARIAHVERRLAARAQPDRRAEDDGAAGDDPGPVRKRLDRL